MTALSEQAKDMLTNAEPRIGGKVGIGSEEAEAELRAASLISPKRRLTRLGLQLAREYQRDFFGGEDEWL
ncbi:hypothetical protein [Streptomyces sp. MH60]|uniref:hypothetical protein n=1 Tax=Streptomyces sp. MH60 TaxID=1940758 RepID=UPI000CEF289C|nr:hypothetical protein [Streptomyces sp. MH60]PPS89565.1 hypothetical protein BZZ08_01712 [Streptomyces sp. MH60]